MGLNGVVRLWIRAHNLTDIAGGGAARARSDGHARSRGFPQAIPPLRSRGWGRSGCAGAAGEGSRGREVGGVAAAALAPGAALLLAPVGRPASPAAPPHLAGGRAGLPRVDMALDPTGKAREAGSAEPAGVQGRGGLGARRRAAALPRPGPRAPAPRRGRRSDEAMRAAASLAPWALGVAGSFK